MANQQNSYTGSQGTGTNSADFPFTFPSFTTGEVKVEVDNVVKTLTTHYTVENYNTTSGGTVRFTAGNIPTGTTPLRIFRQTDVESPKAEFSAGASLKAGELNDNFKQIRYALQEGIGAAATDRKVQRFNIEADSIDGTLIADDVIDSEHYVAGSIDLEHMSANSVDSDQYVDGSIDGVHIANDQIDSQHYAAGSIDLEHMSANSVDSDQYVDGSIDLIHMSANSVDSDQYVDGSIDSVHLAADVIDGTKLADNSVNSEHYVDGSIDHEHLNNDVIDGDNIQDDVVDSEHIAAGALDNEHYAAGSITSDKLNGATVVTNAEQAAASVNDTSFFTTSASDARYFNISSGDTIKDGQTFPDNDTTIATTAAINDRIIDLVDDVGGFVPIASETVFPNANPDVNNGTGTLISIKEIGASRTPSNGTVTIANGNVANNATITITGCGSTVLTAGFGAIVETTTTLHTYTFHRLTPKATEVTTVAGISGNVTTVAGISSNVTTVAGIASNVTTVAGVSSNVTTVANSISSVNNASNNISSVNNFGDKYQVASSNPSTDGGGNALAEGDLYFNTTANELKVYNGSAWQGGVTATGNFAVVTGNTFTGDNVYNDNAKLKLGTGSDLEIFHNANDSIINDAGTGDLKIQSGGSTKLQITSSGAELTGNLDVSSGLDVTGNITVTGTVDGIDIATDVAANTAKVTNATHTGDVTGATTLTIADDAVTYAKMQNVSATDRVLGRDSSGAGVVEEISPASLRTMINVEDGATADQSNAEIRAAVEAASDSNVFTDADHTKLNGIAASANNYVHPNHSGEVTSTADGATVIADDVVDEANLKISNAGSNGQFLSKQSGNTGGLTWATVNTELVGDTSPQLGGDLASNGNDIDFADSDKAIFGTGSDLEIFHGGSQSEINNITGGLVIKDTGGFMRIRSDELKIQAATGNENYIECDANGAVQLFYDNAKKAETVTGGFTVTGTCTATAFAGDGSSLTGLPPSCTGGGSDEIFWENGQTVTTNYTITNNKNAMSAGPITINNGVVVTIGTGETWTIV